MSVFEFLSQFPGGHGWRERESQYRDKDGVVLELCRTKIEKLAVDEIKKKKKSDKEAL